MEAVAAGLPVSGGHGAALVLKEQLGGAPWGAEAPHGALSFFVLCAGFHDRNRADVNKWTFCRLPSNTVGCGKSMSVYVEICNKIHVNFF